MVDISHKSTFWISFVELQEESLFFMRGMRGCRRERVVMAGEKKSQQKANSNGNGNKVVIQ